ncbi:MAG: C25 family cysteine peptidase, partial [Bacteroidota bacterium]
MRKLLTLTLILVTFGFNQVFAQWIGITSDNPAKMKKELISSDVNTSRVNFTLEGFYQHKVETPNGMEYVVSTDGATPILKAGAPDVAKTTASVIIPDMDEMQVEVVSAKYKEFENISIAPSKGNLSREVDPEEVPYEYGEEYEEDAFYPSEIATLRTPYILRDYRGQTVVVNPFRYNPVTQTLRVYYDVEVEITSTGNTGENAFNRTREFSTLETEFKNIYAQQFLNYGNEQRYTPVEEEGSILIIAYGDFMEAMQPYIDWKIMTGREVEMVDVADIGGSSEIETYIEDYYYDNDLAYCLLVGDVDQVPTSYANGDSDNNYAYIEGSDSYPEIFMGRFSAESVGDVETQVQRTIDYEKEPNADEEWYPNSTSISSNEGPGDDGEYDYEHLRNIQEDLNEFGYTYNYELFDGSQGGNDDNGNPTPADVAEVVNSGTTIINYTGHGSTTSWSSSGFSNSDVNNLENDEKLPFIWSVACVNGNFVGNTCFAEAWLRATDNDGNPTGSIATMMSTINQTWNPPMYGQDEMNDILTEQYDDNIKRTFGGISFNGCMGMNDEYGSGGDDMTDTWTLFGDPSVMVRTNNPSEISATHNPTIFLGSSSFTVNVTDAEGATVAMTMDGEIYGTATIEGGAATVEFDDPVNDPGMMNLVITAFNKIPYIAELEAIPAEGPYVTLADFSLESEAN